MTSSRETKIRRSRRTQQGIVALGAAGALGTAVALGATAANGAAAATTSTDRTSSTDDGTTVGATHKKHPRAQQNAPAPSTTLIGSGGGGSSQATTSGS
jgi:hypothetical protein